MQAKIVRLVRRGVVPSESSRHDRAVEVIRNLTDNIDTETITYLVRRDLTLWNILPGGLMSLIRPWLVLYSWLASMPTDELIEAAQEARPDCGTILDTEAGRRWLMGMLSIL